MSKPFKSDRYYSDLAKRARKAGLAKFDSRNLTPAQKGYLTKLENKHKDILDNPEKYFVRHVGEKTLKAVKDAGLNEYQAIKGKVYAKKHADVSLHISSSKSGDILVSRSAKRRKTSPFKIRKNAMDIFKDVKRLEKRLEKLQNMGINAVLVARFGDKGFFQQKFDSGEEMAKYLQKFTDQQLRYLSIHTWDADDEEEI